MVIPPKGLCVPCEAITLDVYLDFMYREHVIVNMIAVLL